MPRSVETFPVPLEHRVYIAMTLHLALNPQRYLMFFFRFELLSKNVRYIFTFLTSEDYMESLCILYFLNALIFTISYSTAGAITFNL